MALHMGNLSKCSTTFVVIVLFTCLLLLVFSQSSIGNSPRTQYRLCRVDGRPLEQESHPHPQGEHRKGKPKDHAPSKAHHANDYYGGASKTHSAQTSTNEDNLGNFKGEKETHLTEHSLFKANHLLLNFSHAKDREVKNILRPHGSGVLWTSFSSPPGGASSTQEREKKYHAEKSNHKNGHHHVHVHGNQTLQYEGPREGEKLPVGISMFHAMHCLLYLREILQDVLEVPPITPSPDSTLSEKHHRDGTMNGQQHENEHDGHHHLHFHDPETHILHCWSYITQQVMCLGDTTLEPPWIERDSNGEIKRMGIDGHGVHHTCKDLGALTEVVGKVAAAGAMGPNGKVFEDWGWRDGQRVEDVSSLFV